MNIKKKIIFILKGVTMKENNPQSENIKTIELDLSHQSGRKILKEYYYDLTQKGKSKRSAFGSIFHAKRICQKGEKFVFDEKLFKPIGIFSKRFGRKIWMETIIVPFYANNIQSMVYFGAITLLIFVALRMLGIFTKEWQSTIGMIIEAVMLFFLAYILFYTPEDYFSEHEKNSEPISNQVFENLKISVDNFTKTGEDLKSIVTEFKSVLESNMEQNIKGKIHRELLSVLSEVIDKTKNNILPLNK
jgi:predicted transposase